MKKLFLTIVSAAFILTAATAQNQIVDVKNNKREMTRDANKNIKKDVPTVDVEIAVPQGYKAPEVTRGANASSLTKAKRTKTRGVNANIKKDEPTKDVEKVRPAYNKVKPVAVAKATPNKMRGANSNIINDEPSVDKEAVKPVNYEEPNTKGKTIKQVSRKASTKVRGENPNIKTDVPSTDVEQARPTK